MVYRANWPPEYRERVSRLHKLLLDEGFLRASLVEMKRRCGYPNCRCTRGELHRSLYLCRSQKARTRMKYVPAASEERAREWVARYKEARRLLDEIAELSWQSLDESKG